MTASATKVAAIALSFIIKFNVKADIHKFYFMEPISKNYFYCA
jgi:hypothetical protein